MGRGSVLVNAPRPALGRRPSEGGPRKAALGRRQGTPRAGVLIHSSGDVVELRDVIVAVGSQVSGNTLFQILK
jgi:hypothetical protein